VGLCKSLEPPYNLSRVEFGAARFVSGHCKESVNLTGLEEGPLLFAGGEGLRGGPAPFGGRFKHFCYLFVIRTRSASYILGETKRFAEYAGTFLRLAKVGAGSRAEYELAPDLNAVGSETGTLNSAGTLLDPLDRAYHWV
jgi:hypothetical protein